MERITAPRWRKSTYSGSNGGGCVELADHGRSVLVRDTQDRSGPVLRFGPAAWHHLTGRFRAGPSCRWAAQWPQAVLKRMSLVPAGLTRYRWRRSPAPRAPR